MAAGKRDKPGADLSAYLDGELPEEQARRVERQLEQSDECRQTVEQLREVSDLLANLPRHRAPEELTTAMRRRAERRELLEETRSAGGGRVLKLMVRLTAAAAVLTACVLVGWQVGRRDRAPAVYNPGAKEHTVASKAEPDLTRRAGKRGRIEIGTAIEAQPTPALAVADKDEKLSELDPRQIASLGFVEGATEENVAEAAATPAAMGLPVVALDSEVEQQVTLYYTIEPAVDIQITPQSAEEYTAIYAALTSGTIAGQSEHDFPWSVTSKEYGLPPERAQFQWKIPSGQVGLVIKALERQAPEQVYVAFTAKGEHIDRLGKLLYPALSNYEPAAKSRITRISGEPAAPARQAVPRKDTTERVKQLRNEKGGGATGLAGREEAAPPAPGPPITTERRLRAEVKKRIEERLAATLGEDSEEPQSQPAVTPSGEGGRGSSPPRDMELFHAFVSLLREALHPEPQPVQETVSFRVTLVAPPASSTSQATTKPALKQPSTKP